MKDDFTLDPLGDSALVVSFGNRIDEALNQRVLQLFNDIREAVPFVKDVVPGYASLAVYYDVFALRQNKKPAFEQVKEWLLPLLQAQTDKAKREGRTVDIPVCYAAPFAPDLHELAAGKQLSPADVVRRHTAPSYLVYMIGFLPGFPYMGKVDPQIAAPRRSSPRLLIPAGSVGIAGEQTGIYPLASPGGWNIIGRTPLALFNKEKEVPVLLQPGDRVRFYSITEDEFKNYQGRLA